MTSDEIKKVILRLEFDQGPRVHFLDNKTHCTVISEVIPILHNQKNIQPEDAKVVVKNIKFIERFIAVFLSHALCKTAIQ